MIAERISPFCVKPSPFLLSVVEPSHFSLLRQFNLPHFSLLRQFTEDRALIIEEIQQLPPFAAPQIPLLILVGVYKNVFE
jgi:hypothetical protein